MFNRSDAAACVVIPGQESDVVFQPGNLPRTGGEFRVEIGQTTDDFGDFDAFRVLNQSCKVQCPNPTEGLEGCLQAATAGGCCLEREVGGEPPVCNQLVIRPRSRVNQFSGEFIIQYEPQGMSPINITVRFSK